MNKIIALLLILTMLALSACNQSQSTSSRAERSKPRLEVTSQVVMLRRAPAANALIMPDGTLKIDDVDLPQSPATRVKLQKLFGQLQMLRQHALGIMSSHTPPDTNTKPNALTLQTTPEIDALKTELLHDIPALQPYQESFSNLKASPR
ncbi:hypothetical protein LZ757_05455 [Xylella fastidiosa subsp. morus]|uniref:Lipoprotein n=1 Tax=Xylella fastidiosa subsp. sandyi Ann-1 TaxID=155920 RepID=A0A060H388_XYLFS|nr:hypothetical protein [Xylella fastidiosa]AIC10023.1 hypothetical protein D934_06775 [Xylella fastidiosa subsp. sandyi Ann-1]AIC12500.1 hypothetical protein P303_05515 [Xylella fastidiosa MUL0034]EWG14001.1 hypothetical protein P910_002704 [Xylella fastidiosa Mul-MD]UIN27873.1 hypothetical protein IUD23_11525 [Xylella fastidiosa subsp. morus]UIT37651.1 hypothetical protein LZ757_05455 [Xylella fastidiosa subsp. morus]